MAVINFPDSPSDGATQTVGGITYTYSSSKGYWTAAASSGGGGGGGASVTTSDNPPANPSQGDLWFDSSVAKTYIYYSDGSSSQWVQLNPSGGSDGTDGADGADATGDGESPIIYTEPATTHALNNNGATSTVQMQAVDPEGTAITYGIAYANSTNARPDQLSADTTINQTTGVYTFTPSTTQANAGSFKARLSASDGVQTSTRFVNFSLAFIASVEYLVVAGGGGGGSGQSGGGGGAGGLIANSATLNSGTYNVTVGTGGAVGANGTASSFNGDSTIGGGHGANFVYNQASSPGNGGSGGGGLGYYIGSTNGGTGTTNQGYDGGDGANWGSGGYKSGGGGGAGAVGYAASSTSGGNGGAGYQWVDGNFYAAGGGGAIIDESSGSFVPGDGGSNIGGDGKVSGATASSPRSATAGAANTGSGGGGGGGAGADGVVIIRTTALAQATTGSPTLTTSGSYNIYTFTADGSITF